MSGTLESTGIASREMFEKLLPSAERRAKGPYVVMECYEQIPCDPCKTSCGFKAVKMDQLNDCPSCDYSLCTGCGSCVGRCPGLACFVINETVGGEKIDITFPYEQLPVPKKGDTVEALGRDGAVVGKAEIVRVLNSPRMDHTNVVTMRVDKSLLYDARNIRCI